MRDWRELINFGWQPELAWREQAKLLEAVLRAVASEDISEAAVLVVGRWQALGQAPIELVRLLKTVFNDVSLSPWTGFVANALAFVQALVRWGEWLVADEVDFLGWLLRQLCRHLTAYDLVTFHHRGANYPDALLLDAALKQLLQLAERTPELFLGEGDEKVLRRRALRQGAVIRRSYEGHAVPDTPTSPGENTRVLPAPFARVPDEQLAIPGRRPRRLFEDDPLEYLWTPTMREILRESLIDLHWLREVNELGMAIFVDRPFGFGKAPLEPDQTPLLAHLAWSRAIAKRRLDELTTLGEESGVVFPEGWPYGREYASEAWGMEFAVRWRFDAQKCGSLDRPVAGIADARRGNDDFWIASTLPGSLRQLQELFNWETLYQRFALKTVWNGECCKCLRIAAANNSCGVLVLMEGNHRKRLVFEVDPGHGFRCRGGVELPVAGLRIWQVMEDDGTVHDLRRTEVHVVPRF